MRSGEQLPVWHVVAQNDASDSGNEIHSDDVAQQYGFRGGLVPGITVYGYMTGPTVAAWGPEWLDRGGMRFRLRRPVYEGEKVEVRAEVSAHGPDRSELELRVLNPDGEVCALGTAWMPTESVVFPGDLPERREPPATRWPPVRETFEREPVLGFVEAVFKEERVRETLEALQDGNAVYREGAVHPAWILRQANLVVDRSVAVNPWIHVSSDIQNLRRVGIGEIVETRASVRDLFEKNDQHYVDLDIVMTARAQGSPPDAGVPVLCGEHRAIYRPRRAD